MAATTNKFSALASTLAAAVPSAPSKQKPPKNPAPKPTPKQLPVVPPAPKVAAPKGSKPSAPTPSVVTPTPPPSGGPEVLSEVRDLKGTINKLMKTIKDLGAAQLAVQAALLAAPVPASAAVPAPPAGGGPPAGGPPPGGAVPQPGPGQAPVPVIPPPVLPQKSPLEIVMEYVDNYVVRVPAEYVDRVTNQLGFRAAPSNPGINGVNPHELAAAARRVATLYVIRHLVMRNHWKIDAYYGNYRDEGFATAINNILVQHGHAPMLEINVVGGWIVANDMRRRSPDSQDIGATAAFSMDVYSLPASGGLYTPVTPEAIAAFGYAEFCWVGHEFHDLWGAMDTVFWHRDRDTIHWYSDATADPYEPHDACDSLHVGGGSSSHTWTVIKSWNMITSPLGRDDSFNRVKTYDVLSVVQRAANLLNYVPPRRSPSQGTFDTSVYDRYPLRKTLETFKCGFMTDTIADFLIDQCNGYSLPTIRVRISKHHFLYAKAQFAGRTKNRLSVSSVRQFVSQMCNSDEVYMTLERNYPDFFCTYREDVVMAVTTHASKLDAERANDTRRVHAQNFSAYNDSLRNMDTPIEPSRPWLKIILAVVAVVMVRKFYVNAVATADSLGGLTHNLQVLQVEHTPKLRAASHSVVDKSFNFVSRVTNGCSSAIKKTSAACNPRVWLQSTIGFFKWLGKGCAAFLGQAYRVFCATMRASQGVFNNWDFPGVIDYVKPQGIFSLAKTRPGMVFQTVVLRPLLEEIFKKNLGIIPGSLLLSSLDVISNLDLVRLYQGSVHDKINVAIESWVTCLSLHLACAVLPTAAGTILHSSFNASMLARQSELGLLDHRRPGVFNHGSAAMTVSGRALIPRHAHVMTCSSSAGEAIATAVLSGNVGPLVSMAKDLIPSLMDAAKTYTPGQLPNRKVNPVSCFDGYWYEESVRPQNFLGDDVVGMTRMTDHQIFVPAVSSVNDTLPDKDSSIKCVQTTFFAEEEDVRSGYYRIYGVSTPMFKPAKTGINAMFLVTHRLTKAIPYRAFPGALPIVYAAMSGASPNQQLSDAAPYVFNSQPWDEETFWYLLENPVARAKIYGLSVYDTYGTVLAGWKDLGKEERFLIWLEHTDPSKRAAYRMAFKQNVEDPLDVWHSKVRGIQVNIKCDEVLLKPDWVPRPIDAVHPRLAVELGVEVYAVQIHLKERQILQEVGFFVHEESRYPFTITCGAGRDAEFLSTWFNQAIEAQGLHVIVAGDDSLVTLRLGEVLYIIESDVSQNDHSIRLPMLMLEWMILADSGMSVRAIKMLARNAAAPRIVTFRNSEHGNVVIHREPERNTGGTDTTVGNTLASQAGWTLFAILFTTYVNSSMEEMHEWLPDAVHNAFSNVGLSVKTRLVYGPCSELGQSFWPGSFLKGTWWKVEGYKDLWFWSVLPSRFIKVSKMLSDPRKVYRLPGERKLTWDDARARHMCALAKSLLPFAMPPELFSWLKSFLDLPVAEQIRPLQEDVLADWKPKAGDLCFSITSFVEQSAVWYGVEADMVQSWLEHVVALQPGVFSYHPMWEVMAKRDYC